MTVFTNGIPGTSRLVNINQQILSIVSGTPQGTPNTMPFPLPLVVKLADTATGTPISGVSVTFTAPGASASGTFAGGSTTYSSNTNASGFVTTTTFTANGTAGSYNVTATASGVAGSVSFQLTNTGSCFPLEVTSGADTSTCGTLRYAVTQANSLIGAGPVTITLDASVNLITLNSLLPRLNNSSSNILTLNGSCTTVGGRGKPGTTIKAGSVFLGGWADSNQPGCG